MAIPSTILTVGAETSQFENDILSSARKVERDINRNIKLNFNTRDFEYSLGRITGQASEFNKSLEASNARVIAFGASAGIIFGISKAFQELVASTINVEKAFADINVILNATGKNFDNFKSKLFDVAKSTGQTFQTTAEAATQLVRQGLSMEETLKRTRDALILTRISGSSFEDSLTSLTAGINSFNKSALDSTQIVNKLANVDSSFAVSARDLAEAIKRTGSAAQDAGLSIDQLIALVTAAQVATGRGGAVIAGAFNTIFNRIQRPAILSQLEELGVKIKDVNNNALPTIELLKNISTAVNSTQISTGSKTLIEEAIGGVRQLNILKATLSDLSKEYSVFNQSQEISAKSTNEAIERNSRLNDTLAAQLNALKVNATQAFSKVGDSTISSPLKQFVGLLNESLESVNSEGIGNKIAQGIFTGISDFLTGPAVALVGIIGAKLIVNFGSFVTTAAKQLISLSDSEVNRLVIEKNITEELNRQPFIIEKLRNGTLTQIEAEQTYLQLLRQQTAEREKFAAISSATAQSVLSQGLATISKSSTGLSVRSVNNFSPLDDAVNREILLGANPSTIKVGTDGRLVNSGNPQGLGVYNTINEPHGLGQGIDRVLGKGIPNFAEPGANFQTGFPLFPSNPDTSIPIPANPELSFDSKIREKMSNDLRILDHLRQQAALDYLEKSQKDFGKNLGNTLEGTIKVSPIDTSKLQEKIKNIIPQIIAEEEDKIGRAIERIFQGNKSPISSGGLISGDLIKYQESIKLQNGFDRVFAGNKSENSFQENPIQSPILNKFRQDEITRLAQQQASQLSQQQASQNSLNSAKFNKRLANFGIGASFLAPVAAGIVEQAIPDDSTGGRGARGIVSGLGQAASFAGIGAAVGGGIPGAVIGGVVGLGLSLNKVVEDFNNQIPEFSKAMETAREKLTLFQEGTRNYASSLENYANAITSSSNRITPEEILKRQANVSEALLKIPEEFRQKIAAAAGDAKKLGDALNEVTVEISKQTNNAKTVLAIEQIIPKGIFSSNVFGNDSKGNSALQDISSQIFNNFSSSVKTPENFAALQKAAISGNSQEFNSVLSGKFGAGSDLIGQLNKVASNSPEDAQRLALAIASMAIQFQNALNSTKQLAGTIKENDVAAAKAKTTMDALNKSLGERLGSLAVNLDIAKTSTLGRNDLLFNGNNLQRNILSSRVQSNLGLATPFLSQESLGQFQSDIKVSDLQSKALEQIQAQIFGTQQKFTGVIGDIIGKAAKDYEATQNKGDEGDGPAKIGDLAKSESARKKLEQLSGVFADILQGVAANPQSGISLTPGQISAKLTNAGVKGSENNLITDEIKKLVGEQGLSLAKILQTLQADVQIAKEQLAAEQQLVAQQRRLNFAGGASDFLGGSSTSTKISDLARQRIANGFLQDSDQRSLETGRTSFKIADLLTNSFNIPSGDLPSYLIDQAKQGRAQDLRDQLGSLQSLTLEGAPSGQRARINAAFGNIDVNKIVNDQVNSQLKLESMPENVAKLVESSANLRALIDTQGKTLQSTNQTAFENALKAVGLDNTTKSIDNVRDAIKEININKAQIDNAVNLSAANTKVRSAQYQLQAGYQNEQDLGENVNKYFDNAEKITKQKLGPNAGPILNQINQIRNQPLGSAINSLQRLLQDNQLHGEDVVGLGEAGGFSSSSSSGVFSSEFINDFTSKNYLQQLGGIRNQRTSNLGELQNATKEEKDAIALAAVKLSAAQKFGGISAGAISSPTIGGSNLPINPFLSGGNLGFGNGSLGLGAIGGIPSIASPVASIIPSAIIGNDTSSARRIAAGQSTTDLTNSLASASQKLQEMKDAGISFSDSMAAAAQNVELLKIQAGQITYGNGIGSSFLGGFQNATTFGVKDQLREISLAGQGVEQDLKTSFGNAFKTFADGTGTATQALQKLGIGFSQALLNRTIDFGTNSLFNGLFGSNGSAFTAVKGALGFATGGLVNGGSGVTDDVPAMMSGGEYVIKKSAVQQYGLGFLNHLNNGGMARYASGGGVSVNLSNGFDYGPNSIGGGGTAGDIISPGLSNFALSDDNSVQNRIRFQRQGTYSQYLNNLDKYNIQNQYAQQMFGYQEDQRVIGAGIGVGTSLAGYGLGQAFHNPATIDYNSNNSPPSVYTAAALGGYISKFANGGSAGDTIPALLTGGEYVMKASTVDRYGKGLFDKINAGRYAQGGVVTDSNNGSGQIIDLLSQLVESFKNTKSPSQSLTAGKTSALASTPTNSAIAQPTNTFNITVNVASNGTSSSNISQTTSNNQTNQNNNDATKTAAALSAAMTQFIVAQQRPGGLLYKSS